MKLSRFSLSVPCVIVLCALATISSPGQNLRTLVNFDATNGGDPRGSLVQGMDGNLYGTTGYGGANNIGTIFRMTPNGTLTTIYDFCTQTGCATGTNGGLVLATDGNFYGTAGGGSNGVGTIFKITASGTLTTLFDFDYIHGAYPEASLVQGADDALYGTTLLGGVSGRGTIFKITLSGAFTLLYKLGSNRSDGANPQTALVLGSDGNLYGVTPFGGNYACADGCGTIFKITPVGTFTTLHSFNLADGAAPEGALIQARDGNFYGTTFGGGANGSGTVFQISPAGALKVIYSFDIAGGTNPAGGLVEGVDGNLYGTTSSGGTRRSGTVFAITTAGTLTTLGNLGRNTSGANPISAMVEDTNGSFYGEGYYGGSGGYGTVFNLSVGLGRFITTLPNIGSVRATVRVLGNNLSGATSVTFNGTPATFTVTSPTLIKTTVPDGASTGFVQVVTPGGTLTSNTTFRVQ